MVVRHDDRKQLAWEFVHERSEYSRSQGRRGLHCGSDRDGQNCCAVDAGAWYRCFGRKGPDVIIGLISERDIVHAISQHGERALAMVVSEVMTLNTVTVTPNDPLRRAMSLMTNHRLRHLTVIDKGKLVGIVSIGDVVEYRLDELETESNILRDAYIAAH